MKGVFIAEWLIATGIITYRTVKQDHGPPSPGALAIESALFVGLGIVADAGPDAERLAALFGFGLIVAAFMGGFGGKTTTAAPKATTAAASSGKAAA